MATSTSPPQTLTQSSASEDPPLDSRECPAPDSGVVPQVASVDGGGNRESGTLMDEQSWTPNPEDGVLPSGAARSGGDRDGDAEIETTRDSKADLEHSKTEVVHGDIENGAGMSEERGVCNPGDEARPTDASMSVEIGASDSRAAEIAHVDGVAENITGMDDNGVAENITGMDDNGVGQASEVHRMQSDMHQDFKPVDENLNGGGVRTVDVDSVFRASKVTVVAEAEVVEEACTVQSSDAMDDENLVVGARVEEEGCDSLGDRKLGVHAMESNVSPRDNQGEKQMGGSDACEVGISLNGGSLMMGSQAIDRATGLDDNGENIVGIHVAEVRISVLGENRTNSVPAVDMDSSLDGDKGTFVESCASEVGAAVLSESSPAVNLGSSVVVDKQKVAGSDLSEMGLSKVCDYQMAANPAVESDTSEKKISNVQMKGSSAEHLETHLGTDGKKLSETNDCEAGISFFSGNQMTGGEAVDLAVPLATTVASISQPDDSHGNGIENKETATSGKDKEKEPNGELTYKEENPENEDGVFCDGTLKTGDGAAVQLPVIEEKQNVGHMSPTSASIRNEYQASYCLPQEKKGRFSVSDLIWGKVRSHPWWPGQIFDPSDSSELAIKYKKKAAFLVAYFGDQTFAWCEESQLKPFCTHFPRMEKQSTSEAFLNAVNCALDEVSRRVQLGLTCSCMPEEVNARIKNQRIENAGIRDGASGAGSADTSLFEPRRLLEYIKELALLPLNGGEILELVIAKAQLMPFYCSKGYLELPAFYVHGGLVEHDSDFSPGRNLSKDTVGFATPISTFEDKKPSSLESGEEKAKSRRGSSRKRNLISEDSLQHTRKQKSLADLMSGKKASNLVSSGKSSIDGKATGKSGTSPSGKKRKAVDSFPDDSVQTRTKRLSSLSDSDLEAPSAKRSFAVGDCIRRIAGKLTGSPPILKFSGERFQNNAVKVDSERDTAVHVSGFSHSPKEKQKRKIGIPEYPSPCELLSQLCLAARDPMKGYSFVSAVVSFFTDFRDSIHLEHSCSGKKIGSGKTGRGKSSNSRTDSDELSELNEMKDSYWTDMIIHGSTEEEPSQKSHKRKGEPQLETPKKKRGRPPRKQSNSLESSPKLDSDMKQQVNEDMVREEECSPTALILFFNAANSVPSETNLSKIFSRYGPLKESETMRKSNRAKVVFCRRSDAEEAFSKAGKFSIFGPGLVSYRLKYLPSKPKSTRRSSRQGKKDEASAEGNNLVSPRPGKDDTGQTRDGSEVPGSSGD